MMQRWNPFSPRIEPDFLSAVVNWMSGCETTFVDHIWTGFETMERRSPPIDGRDLERSITQNLDVMIRDAMSGDEPYYMQHGPYERETMARPPAQPPAYDLAFVFRADPRIMWPIEAKVIETPGAIAHYLADIRDQFLTCRYGPFSPSGAMVAYLLQGQPSDMLENVQARLGNPIEHTQGNDGRAHAKSTHMRDVPQGKHYPPVFGCYHVVFTFHGLQRVMPDLPRG